MSKFRWAYIGSGNIANSTAKEIVKGNHVITSVYSRKLSKACALYLFAKSIALSKFLL